MTEIEDQALTVYALWRNSAPAELRDRYLNGLFELLEQKFPVEAQHSVADVAANWLSGAKKQ